MIIQDNNLKLIKAFIEREAEDFTPNKPEDWVKAVLEMIKGKVAGIEDGNYLTINSYGNAGFLSSQLKIDIYCKCDKSFNYNIRLCPCGQLKHTVFMVKEEIK
jgi:hypothetical protein